MTTEELVTWAHDAINKFEASWVVRNGEAGQYTITRSEAVERTKPKQFKLFEKELAETMVYQLWNETIEWYEEYVQKPKLNVTKIKLINSTLTAPALATF